ncbi:MAG: dihydrofolate reductase [Streptococcaceae bacterium]|jgi:dihydrofolate reductase|nr:dihydrofolate reductase [Streptococcaceae bacterium]
MIVGIWAEDEQGLIGVKGTLPWSLPAELQHFKKTTMGQAILMGRKTFDGMHQRVLPGRTTIVLTRDPAYQTATSDVRLFNSPDDVLAWYQSQAADQAKDLYIIGGAEMFKAFQGHFDRLYRTIVAGKFEGDTYFPQDALRLEQFEEVASRVHPADEQNAYAFTIKTYESKK